MPRRMIASFTAAALSAGLLAAPAAAQAPDRGTRPPLGPVPELDLPSLQRSTMANGLELIVVEKREVPLVQLNVLVGAGSAREEASRLGLASLTADMLDEGAAGRSALDIGEAFESLGARFSISAGLHTAQLSLRVPVTRLPEALAIAADVLLRPDFPAGELERKRADRITGLIRRHDEPNAIAAAAFDRIVYGEGHPYGRTSGGTEATLTAITVDDLRAFHRAWYRAGNATVVVVGDIEAAAARRIVEDALGGWQGGDVPAADIPGPSAHSGRTVYLVDKPGSAQSVISIGHLGVPRSTPDYATLEVLNTVLGGSFTSRLNQNLREDKGYTYGAGSDFDFGIGTGAFSASAAVQTDATAPALAEFVNELEAIREPIPADELERARNFLAMRYPAGFQSVAAVAGRIGELVQYDLPDDTFDRYVASVLGVTPDAALEAARARIRPDDLAFVVVGDRARIEDSIRALGLGEIRLLTVEDVLGPVPVRTGT